MKSINMGASVTIITGVLRGHKGWIIEHDKMDDKVTLNIDDITHIMVASQHVE